MTWQRPHQGRDSRDSCWSQQGHHTLDTNCSSQSTNIIINHWLLVPKQDRVGSAPRAMQGTHPPAPGEGEGKGHRIQPTEWMGWPGWEQQHPQVQGLLCPPEGQLRDTGPHNRYNRLRAPAPTAAPHRRTGSQPQGGAAPAVLTCRTAWAGGGSAGPLPEGPRFNRPALPAPLPPLL